MHRPGNRTVTYTSLLGFVGLLFSTSKEQFNYYYRLATGEDGGNSTWYYMQKGKKI